VSKAGSYSCAVCEGNVDLDVCEKCYDVACEVGASDTREAEAARDRYRRERNRALAAAVATEEARTKVEADAAALRAVLERVCVGSHVPFGDMTKAQVFEAVSGALTASDTGAKMLERAKRLEAALSETLTYLRQRPAIIGDGWKNPNRKTTAEIVQMLAALDARR
jgi:hypothetical protein